MSSIENKNEAVAKLAAMQIGPQLPDESPEAYAIRILISRAVLLSAKTREDSYDAVAAEAASAAYEVRKAEIQAADPSDYSYVYLSPNYTNFYRYDLTQAAQVACKQLGIEHMHYLVYLALDGWWNDTMDWATGKYFQPAPDLPEGVKGVWVDEADTLVKGNPSMTSDDM